VNGGSISAGQVITVAVQVASATSGKPTGTVALSDGATALATGRMSEDSSWTVPLNSLTPGSHTLTASYFGDNNFLPSASPAKFVTIVPPAADGGFTLAVAGTATQSVVAGSEGSFAFTVQPQPNLASQVTFSASGLPDHAVARFSPAYAPPGGPTSVLMSIATSKTTATRQVTGTGVPVMAWLPLGLVILSHRRRGRRWKLLSLAAATLSLALVGCGDRVNRGDSVTSQPKNYTITVTGTATGTAGTILQHTITFNLAVVPSN
jgi:hypothetical protein